MSDVTVLGFPRSTYAHILRLASTLRTWIARAHQRRDLRQLALGNPHLLKDIGVPRDEALHEAAKPFWLY